MRLIQIRAAQIPFSLLCGPCSRDQRWVFDPQLIQHDSLLALKLPRRDAYSPVDRMNVLLDAEEVEVLRG